MNSPLALIEHSLDYHYDFGQTRLEPYCPLLDLDLLEDSYPDDGWVKTDHEDDHPEGPVQQISGCIKGAMSSLSPDQCTDLSLFPRQNRYRETPYTD